MSAANVDRVDADSDASTNQKLLCLAELRRRLLENDFSTVNCHDGHGDAGGSLFNKVKTDHERTVARVKSRLEEAMHTLERYVGRRACAKRDGLFCCCCCCCIFYIDITYVRRMCRPSVPLSLLSDPQIKDLYERAMSTFTNNTQAASTYSKTAFECTQAKKVMGASKTSKSFRRRQRRREQKEREQLS